MEAEEDHFRHIADVRSYQTFAGGMLRAGDAVLRTSMRQDGQPNTQFCNNLVKELFGGGGDVTCDQKRELLQKVNAMITQVVCNEMEVCFYRSHPDRRIVDEYASEANKNVYAFAQQ